MNCGDFALVQSNSQVDLQPQAELKFADFLINQAIDAAFCLGAKAQFIYVNDATCCMTGYSREELLAMTLNDIDIDFSLQEWSKKWQYLTTTPTSFRFKSRYRTKGGRIFLVENAITYIQHQGREFVCAFAHKQKDEIVDLRLQKSIDKLKNVKEHLQKEVSLLKNKEVQLETSLPLQGTQITVQFVSMVSHQLRTPLNVISFSNSLLKRHLDEWTAEKIRSLLNGIQTSVEQINQLLNNMIFFVKVAEGKLNFEPKPLDLVEFCHELVEKMQISSSQHQINFVSQGNCLNVCMDQQLLEPILNNLLDNAIKYSPSHSPIDLKIFCQHDQVIFQIQDFGIGIPLVDRQRLFEPFYRGSNINHIFGAGLGLSVVKTLLDLHGGQIAVESEVNLGSTFTVIVPNKD